VAVAQNLALPKGGFRWNVQGIEGTSRDDSVLDPAAGVPAARRRCAEWTGKEEHGSAGTKVKTES